MENVSLESYYQESELCGRNGLPSVYWLCMYYSRGDFYCADAKNVIHMFSNCLRHHPTTRLFNMSVNCLMSIHLTSDTRLNTTQHVDLHGKERDSRTG